MGGKGANANENLPSPLARGKPLTPSNSLNWLYLGREALAGSRTQVQSRMVNSNMEDYLEDMLSLYFLKMCV